MATADDCRLVVKRAILDPMTDFFEPPRHAASDPEAMRRLLDRYIGVLGGYSERTPQRAWDRVLREHRAWTWPTPGELFHAMEANGNVL